MLTPDHPKPQALYPIKPESGKKRASFLLNAQTSGLSGSSISHAQSQAVLNNHQTSINGEMGQSAAALKSVVDPSYNSHHESTSINNTVPVTSPPKRIGTTRKPSGKSSKSNRGNISKKFASNQ